MTAKLPTAIAPSNPDGFEALPPILAGRFTPAVAERVRQFCCSVASIFESWVQRRPSPHTQRAYRDDVMSFFRFMSWTWPEDVLS